MIMVDAVVPTLEEIGRSFVRINGWPGFLERDVHELAVPDEATAAQITTLYQKIGRSCRIVPDTPGMISARTTRPPRRATRSAPTTWSKV